VGNFVDKLFYENFDLFATMGILLSYKFSEQNGAVTKLSFVTAPFCYLPALSSWGDLISSKKQATTPFSNL